MPEGTIFLQKMHWMNSFFPTSGQNPYFHPGSDDFAFLFLSLAMAARCGGNLAMA
jgi:hypothetical protein